MQRGLPVSILVHILAIVLIFVFGNRVNRPPVKLPHTLDLEFSMITMPEEIPVEQPEPEPEPPAPVIEPEVEAKPAVVPDKPKDIPEEKVQEEKPEPVQKPAEEQVKPAQEEPVEAVVREPEPEPPTPALTGFGVSGTDVDFPFAYYLSLVKTRISRHFNPTRLGFRENTVISCVMHFNIARNGNISQITVVRSSGVDVFDREARRAILAAQPLTKLPATYNSSSLGITFTFNLESGI